MAAASTSLAVLAGDESPGVAHGIAPRGHGQGAAGNRVGRGHGQSQPRRRGQTLPDIVKILLQVPRDARAVGQHRQHVDEAEHLHLDALVLHGPGHDPVVPPAAIQHRRLVARGLLEQVATEFACPALDFGGCRLRGSSLHEWLARKWTVVRDTASKAVQFYAAGPTFGEVRLERVKNSGVATNWLRGQDTELGL